MRISKSGTSGILLALMLVIFRSAPLPAQVGPKFEVASIKPSPPLQPSSASPHVGIKIDGARVDIGYWSIKQLIAKAHGLDFYQLVAPDWTETARFDVLTKIPDGYSQAKVPELLQALLWERFKLAVHRETKEMSGYSLVVAKGGHKMKSAPSDPTASESNPLDELQGAENSFGGKTSFVDGNLHMEFAKIPMIALAQIMGSYLHAPVVDTTGLKGRYQATLEFSQASDPGNTSLLEAVNRLGLRLEPHKAPVNVLVVDHAERVPTAN